MSEKWNIESIRLELGESDLAITCTNCRRSSICLNSITSWVKLTNLISYQDSFFMAASPELDKSGAFQICIQDSYIKVEQPFFLMEICKVKCGCCKIDLGIFLKTVNQEQLLQLEGYVLLKSDKLCDIQPFEGLITMIKQNAQVQLSKVQKNSSLSSSNVAATPVVSYNQSIFQSIISFCKYLRELQYRTMVLETIHKVQQKIAQNQGLFELQGLNQYQQFSKTNSINPFNLNEHTLKNRTQNLRNSSSYWSQVKPCKNKFNSAEDCDLQKSKSYVNKREYENAQTTLSIEQFHSQNNKT